MYGNGQAPIFILKDGTQRTRGRTAQSNNIAAAKAVADAVRSTLGPKGMDKMLVDSMGDVVITNDGATILKEMDIEHPAAKMIIEVAKNPRAALFRWNNYGSGFVRRIAEKKRGLNRTKCPSDGYL